MYDFQKKKRIVLKIGSSLIVKKSQIRNNWLNFLAQDIAKLSKNHEFIIVTSGAIALGCFKMGFFQRDKLTLSQKQAMSAIGQIYLMNKYCDIFKQVKLNVAQILLTASDCNSANRCQNFQNTIASLIDNKVIPIINENDSVAIDEIKIGDNDTLAANVAKITNANLMILLSDIDGLYSSNPHIDKNAKFIDKIEKIDEKIIKMAQNSISKVGTGGMITKIKSAKILAGTGCDTIITCGKDYHCLDNIFNNKQRYSLFLG